MFHDGLSTWHAWGRGLHRILMEKAEWKRSLGITRRRRKDDIKVGLIEIV